MHGSPGSENKINFKVNGREFAFKMTYHEDNSCDRDMISEFKAKGICEPEVVCAMERIVRPGDLVVDGGANIGFFTIYLSQLVGPEGKVIAIEPGENNLWKLEANVRLNGLKNVEIVPKALWSKRDTKLFYMRIEGGRNSLFSGNSFGGYEVGTCVLSEWPDARLIKLDIEGSEAAALWEWEGGGFVIAELNEEALKAMGSDQDHLRSNGETFLLQKDGNLPMYVPPQTKIVTDRQNTNILLSSIDDVAEVWKEIRV